MKWSEFKKTVDDELKGKDPEIFCIDIGVYPSRVKVTTGLTEDNEMSIWADNPGGGYGKD